MDSAIDTLGTLPDRRKSIVYIGQGLPVDPGFLAPQIPGLPVDGGSSSLMTAGLTSAVTTRCARMFERAARANVNVYTVDACGLRAPLPPARFGTRVPTCQPGLEIEYLQAVAENTGARPVINTNEFDAGSAGDLPGKRVVLPARVPAAWRCAAGKPAPARGPGQSAERHRPRAQRLRDGETGGREARRRVAAGRGAGRHPAETESAAAPVRRGARAAGPPRISGRDRRRRPAADPRHAAPGTSRRSTCRSARSTSRARSFGIEPAPRRRHAARRRDRARRIRGALTTRSQAGTVSAADRRQRRQPLDERQPVLRRRRARRGIGALVDVRH